MCRDLVVVLIMLLAGTPVWAQSVAAGSRLPVSDQLPVQYEVRTTADPADSMLADGVPAELPSRDHEQLIKDYMQEARVNDNNGNLVAARNALERMRTELAYVDDPRATAAYHMQLGLLDYGEDQFESAIKNLQTALSMYEGLRDTVLMASCLLNLGNANRELGDDARAIQHYNAALYFYELNGDDASAALALGYVGLLYKEKGERELALSNFYKALALHRKNDYREDICIDLNHIGEVMIMVRDYDEAEPYLLESLALARELDSQSGIIAATYNLGVIDLAKASFPSAEARFLDVLRRARTIRSSVDIRNVSQRLSELYERTGRIAQALDFRRQYDAWKDSVIVQTERDRQFRREAVRRTRQEQLSDVQRRLSDQESARQSTLRTAMIILIVLAGLMTAGAIYFLRYRAWATRTMSEASTSIRDAGARIEKMESQLTLIRSQLAPDFLFGSIDAVSRMVLSGDNKNASLYLNKLARFLKVSLENLETDRVSLENELMQIESYVQMEQLRIDDKVNLEINIDRLADGADAKVPPMILQPFVENALWHGLAHKRPGDPRHLRIHVRERRDVLVCTIEDNGVGRERAEELAGRAQAVSNRPTGIKRAQQRLQLLDKSGSTSLIRIMDLKDRYGNAVGTRVEVMVPQGRASQSPPVR